MNGLSVVLFQHELEAALESLRRDMRSELTKAQAKSPWTLWHLHNARQIQRLLETLNPKNTAAAASKNLTRVNPDCVEIALSLETEQ